MYSKFVPHQKLMELRLQSRKRRREQKAVWRRDWITLPELRQRGWDTAAIKQLLGEPAPMTESGAPQNIRSYRRTDVEAVEKTAAFQAWVPLS
ncbi:hypothetical protein PSI23_20435 [Xenorhabdus sp. XENO-10]|uniref:Integrase n=1 Tax=Xenorhabdus yunnanensis TaxID=3025878 RepID=A0ABT5LKC8_9GAMM|nr:hypothetical protein [Xenorhabdus yunnanensis]MDC9591581.1 hypothetical protein [Xenorhabdus yunnanensis]